MPLFQILSRLPLRIWVRLIVLAFAAAALLAFGVAVIAVVGIGIAIGVLVFKARSWFTGLFEAASSMANGVPRPVPARVQRARATDAEYTIIEHR